MIKVGQPIEIESLDGTVTKGEFFKRWNRFDGKICLVIIERKNESHEQMHYIDEKEIADIRILGPFGKPLLYLV
ncbi:hypothetical protein [Paenibacillus agricola]|nr:hypothetical protein [Paenibacillus agricola]